MVKVDAVFKFVFSSEFDARLDAAKHRTADGLIGIANIFRHEWQQDFLLPPIAEASRKCIEQAKERGLAAHCNGDVLSTQIPAEFLAE